MRIRLHPVTVRFGEAILPGSGASESYPDAQLTAQLRSAVQELIDKREPVPTQALRAQA